jgi:hypothetical protein
MGPVLSNKGKKELPSRTFIEITTKYYRTERLGFHYVIGFHHISSSGLHLLLCIPHNSLGRQKTL